MTDRVRDDVRTYAARQASAAGARVTALAQALTRGDRAAIREAIDGRTDYIEAAVSLVQPAMYVVGELWATGAISTAREHLATALVETQLAAAFPHGACMPAAPRRALCACAPGNRHGLGLRLVADAFELAGWHSFHLGADVPADDLLEFAAQNRCDVVALSVGGTDALEATTTAIAALRHELGAHRPHVLVGGLAVNAIAGLAATLGADEHCVDAAAVFELARRAR